MTGEIIKAITTAEAQAAEIKEAAQAQAAQIIADAQTQAASHEQSSAQVCKAYAETQIKNARAQADENYIKTIQTKKKEMQEYCAKILAQAEAEVAEIVGRITSGDC